MQIRPASTADRALLIQALDQLVVHLSPGEPYLERVREDVDAGAWIDSYLEDPDGRGLVVEDQSGSLACALGRLQDPALPFSAIGRVGFIALVWVHERGRRRGLARRLCTDLEAWFRNRGARWVELTYLCANHEADATWPSLGYTPFRVQARKAL